MTLKKIMTGFSLFTFLGAVLVFSAKAHELDSKVPVAAETLQADKNPQVLVVVEDKKGQELIFSVDDLSLIADSTTLLNAVEQGRLQGVRVDSARQELDDESSAESSFYWSYWNRYRYVGCYGYSYSYWWSGSYTYWNAPRYNRYRVYYPYYYRRW